ncbi:MAG TPA: hypothetical protein VHD62_01865 [Opitutaceae bacterium]|nr:hypothetical protein [Opitutaceae bacterium]
MKYITTKSIRRLRAAFAAVALACGAGVLSATAQTNGSVEASAHANVNATVNGGNLGQGAAALPEASTWIGMGSLLLLAGALLVRSRRRPATT